MRSQYLSLFLLVTSVLPPAATAEVLKPEGSQPQVVENSTMPHRGMSKQAVARKFGQPVNKKPAVGKPPISSWDYGKFSVYFERNHVIHSVSH